MPLNFLVFTFIQIFLGLSILLGHIFSQFASTCSNTCASTCSNTRASTCYYARERLLFKNMHPGIMLESAEGEKIGESKIAARQGITMVILSRIGMATPGMVRCRSICACISGFSPRLWLSYFTGDDTHCYEQAGAAGFLQKVPKSPGSLAGEHQL